MLADMIGGGRPVRQCARCLGIDDHPRCQVQVNETTWSELHHDCHFEVAGDQPCHPQVAAASPGPGMEMLDAILAHHAGEGA